MKLVWHIIRKDVRRFWPLVLLWALLFLLHLFSVWRWEHALPVEIPATLERLKFIEILTYVVQLLTAYIFAAMLVLEDSAVGTSTFWPTRPISGLRLLAAKVSSGFLWFVGLALLLSFPWWMAAGMSREDVTHQIVVLLITQAGVVGTAFVFASFTGSLEKFLGWSVGYCLFAGAVVWGVEGTSHLAETFSRSDPVAIVSLRTNQINAAGAVVALLIQYHTRRRKIAFWGMVALAAMMFVLDVT